MTDSEPLTWIVPLASVVVAVIATTVACFARAEARRAATAAEDAVRASLFDQRFQVFEDVSRYIGAWQAAGTPDLGLLSILVDAWRRSRFLFGDDVTTHIRAIWRDSLRANYSHKIIEGTVKGDRQKAVEKNQFYFDQYCADDTLIDVFKPYMSFQMKVTTDDHS